MNWWEPQARDLATLAKTAIGAGLGTALVQGLLAIYRDARHRHSQAVYLAMRLAVILEAYASACADFVSANQAAETPPDDEFPNWQTKLPELLPYPEDAEGWRAIDRKLAGQCLNLRNMISGSQARIAVTIEFSEDELGDVLDEEAALRGLEAWSIATGLRRKARIEKADTVWNYADSLKEALHRAEKAKAARREQDAKFAKEFLPPSGG